MKVIYEILDLFGEWLGEVYRFIFEELLKTRDHSLKAEFVSEKEILKKNNRGFCLTGTRSLSEKDSYTNAIIAGPVGTGKSTCVQIPSILKMNGSLVVLDISGELFDKTSRAKKQISGAEVKVFNPTNPSKSLTYNPMARAVTSTQINTLADTLIRASLGSNSKDPFWNIMARDVIGMMIKILKTQEPEFQNLYNVKELLFKLRSSPQEVDRLFAHHADTLLLSQYKAFITYDSKLSGSVIATCQSALQLFSDENISKTTSSDSLDMDMLRTQKTILYIQVPVNQINYLSPLITILFSQLFEHTMNSIPHPTRDLDLFYLIDEAAMLRLPGAMLANAISNMRKYRAGMLLIYQNSLSQLTENYGIQNARTILQGAQTKLYFGGQNLETTREISQILGRYEYEDDKGIKRSRDLMTADEVRLLKSDEAIILNTHKRPMKVRMTPYYKQAAMRRLTSLKPLEIAINKLACEEVPLLDLKILKS